MLRRILSFISWALAVLFFLVAISSFGTNLATAIGILLWGLIFFPPLYKFTGRYGLVWNIMGRIFVFFLSAIIAGTSTSSQKTIQSNSQPSPTATSAVVPTLSPTPKVVETIAPTSTATDTPLILSLVDSPDYYLDNNTVPEVVDYAQYIAQQSVDTKRYELVHKAVKCDIPIRGEGWYLKFITLMLAARFPEKFNGNHTYFLAKNIVRDQPETANNLLTVYKTVMCSK